MSLKTMNVFMYLYLSYFKYCLIKQIYPKAFKNILSYICFSNSHIKIKSLEYT